MNTLKKLSFAEKSEVQNKFVLNKVLDSKLLSGLYSQNFFELISLDKIDNNDFIYVIDYGLFLVEERF